MSDQGAGGGFDSTLASGRARAQSENEATSAEPSAEVRSPPRPQHNVNVNYAGAITSEQDPRSSAGTANGTRSPPAIETPPTSMSYEASQLPTQLPVPSQLQQSSQPQGQLNHTQVQVDRHSRHLQKVQQALLQEQQRRQLEQQQQRQRQQPQRHQQQLQQLRLRVQQQQQQQQQQQLQLQQQQLQQLQTHQERHGHHRHHHAHQEATPHKTEPPVTRATLSELDVGKIIHNPKLRHDINYDPELHFRPNLDGEKGRRKQEKAQQFWDTLRDELTQFATNRDEFLQTHGPDDEWCLPALLNAVKDIIQTLVPARDRELLNEGLNVPLLMQQFARGVVDLEKLAAWLSSVLKLHCAPMRDDWVDEMHKELSRGNQENDIDELVKGMCSLLSVLEAMKLDVANHQIRCLRPLLIEDTVHFEQRFFYKKIQNRRMSISAARSWYEQAKADCASPNVRHRQAFGEMTVFFNGLCQLLLPSAEASQVPNTFLFDEDRILKLRSDMFDAVHLEICMRVYEQAEADEVASSTQATYRSSSLTPHAVPAYLDQQNASQTSGDNWSRSSGCDFDFNTPPPSDMSDSPAPSRPASLDFSTYGASSLSTLDSDQQLIDAGVAPPCQPTDFAEAHLRTQNLYSCLVALLHTVQPGIRPTQRWEDLWPKMAVEVYRTLTSVHRAQHLSLEQVEQRLETAMHPGSPMKCEVERTFRERLLSALTRRVKDFKSMPSVGLFVVAAGGRIHPTNGRAPEATTAAATAAAAAAAAAALISRNNRSVDPREDGGVEDMATRLAHLGILHWRVWSRLVYEPEPDQPSDIATYPAPM